MRELKFRAWDGKGMMQSDQFDTLSSFFGYYHEQFYFDDNGVSDVQIMRYTGLKDKRGTEVYEDDIVAAWSQGVRAIFVIKWRQEGSPCWILYPAWQNGEMWHIAATEHKPDKQFIHVTGQIHTTDKTGFYDDGLEVIGNIYESPELLKETL